MSENTIQLNALSAQRALAFFLQREKYRHIQDIVKIDKDLETLKQKGIEPPDNIDLGVWIEA